MRHLQKDAGGFVSRQYVADLLGVSVSTVSRYAVEGKIPAGQMTPGGQRRWLESEIIGFAQRLAASPQTKI